MSYEMKPGKNLVAVFSLVAFEKAKGFISQNIKSTNFADKYQNGAQVEYHLCFYNRKKDGVVGCQQNIVANFYNTRSSLLVNGSRVDIFVKRYCSP